MNFRNRGQRRDQVELPIIPLIDIVIFLLIFFVITTTFDRNSAIVLHLPEASDNKQETPPKEILELSIDAGGRFYVNSKLLINTQSETVQRALADAQNGRTDLALIVNADAQTPHQAVVTALDAARRVGNFAAVSIATRTPSGQQ